MSISGRYNRRTAFNVNTNKLNVLLKGAGKKNIPARPSKEFLSSSVFNIVLLAIKKNIEEVGSRCTNGQETKVTQVHTFKKNYFNLDFCLIEDNLELKRTLNK